MRRSFVTRLVEIKGLLSEPLFQYITRGPVPVSLSLCSNLLIVLIPRMNWMARRKQLDIEARTNSMLYGEPSIICATPRCGTCTQIG